MKKLLIATVCVSLIPLGAAHAQNKNKRPGFAKMDTDKNGAVDTAEWAAGDRNERSFQRFDADGDGSVTREEWKTRMEAVRAARRARRGGDE